MLIYIYIGVLVYYPLYILCVFVCVCVISNQSTSKNQSTCQKSSGRGDLGGGGEWEQAWTKFEKGGRQYRRGEGLHKIGVLATLCQQ